MLLTFSLKALGKKRAKIDQKQIELVLSNESTTRDFLEKLVLQQVQEYQERQEETNLFEYLTENSLKDAAESGNVKFGHEYNLNKVNEEKAVETVCQAFEDGLIALFHNDQQLEKLDEVIHLQALDKFTLLRLTFLTGSFW